MVSLVQWRALGFGGLTMPAMWPEELKTKRTGLRNSCVAWRRLGRHLGVGTAQLRLLRRDSLGIDHGHGSSPHRPETRAVSHPRSSGNQTTVGAAH